MCMIFPAGFFSAIAIPPNFPQGLCYQSPQGFFFKGWTPRGRGCRVGGSVRPPWGTLRALWVPWKGGDLASVTFFSALFFSPKTDPQNVGTPDPTSPLGGGGHPSVGGWGPLPPVSKSPPASIKCWPIQTVEVTWTAGRGLSSVWRPPSRERCCCGTWRTARRTGRRRRTWRPRRDGVGVGGEATPFCPERLPAATALCKRRLPCVCLTGCRFVRLRAVSCWCIACLSGATQAVEGGDSGKSTVPVP